MPHGAYGSAPVPRPRGSALAPGTRMTRFDAIPEAIEAIRNGRLVVVVDD